MTDRTPLHFSWLLPLCTPDWAARPGQWIQLAQAVEYAGLDGLWIPGGALCADSLGVAAALCAHTRRVHLSVSVPPEVMLPAALATTLQSLQSISGHRVHLHLPNSERSAFGEWLNRDQRSERIGEYLHILQQLLAPNEGGLDYQGLYFQLENAGVARRELPAPTLVLDDSHSHALLAEHADTCLLAPGHPQWLGKEIQRWRAIQPSLKFACTFGLILGDSEDLAWETAADWLPVPELPTESLATVPRARHPLRQWEVHPNLLQLAPGQPLILVGTPSQVATRLQELHGLGLNHLILEGGPAVRDVLRFGEQVLPHLRKERPHHEC
ncbi:LLM class flavin-dependent oxidoreductase [Pseudomonas poae]|uniref:LLM class flavin-dependent oxidoreductase n=1 Tax=Pseudomonas poae TaxID=200451 RepID=A0A2S9EU78_9PSED|nr:LLM class flavin-dependent oxidoreductase [Pseudomonas poae]PRA33864.1 LLM class flavin-dependent oxidoreductase [Pseudomonas poae]PRC19545.1 LLM class flavin-dependent oxidoreductase [Pseudomonas poae]